MMDCTTQAVGTHAAVTKFPSLTSPPGGTSTGSIPPRPAAMPWYMVHTYQKPGGFDRHDSNHSRHWHHCHHSHCHHSKGESCVAAHPRPCSCGERSICARPAGNRIGQHNIRSSADGIVAMCCAVLLYRGSTSLCTQPPTARNIPGTEVPHRRPLKGQTLSKGVCT